MKRMNRNKLLDMPWKITNEISRILIDPLVRLIFTINNIPWGKGWKFYGCPIVQKHRQSIITIGSHFQLRSTSSSNPLGPNHPVILCTWNPGSMLEIGDNFGMSGGTICAAESIKIGNNVAVGANSSIVDRDFHPIDPDKRKINPQSAKTAPIVIEDDVFIGMNCLILKGVTIGQGSVIGAGSVVTRSVPPYSIAAGNPAKVIRSLR